MQPFKKKKVLFPTSILILNSRNCTVYTLCNTLVSNLNTAQNKCFFFFYAMLASVAISMARKCYGKTMYQVFISLFLLKIQNFISLSVN